MQNLVTFGGQRKIFFNLFFFYRLKEDLTNARNFYVAIRITIICHKNSFFLPKALVTIDVSPSLNFDYYIKNKIYVAQLDISDGENVFNFGENVFQKITPHILLHVLEKNKKNN